jgi:hypothetical protein
MTALLTTIIGLIGVYIAFALAASWVNEQIATFFQLRSKTLIAGIKSMIGNDAAADFFGHPLIVSLGEIPAQNFWAKCRTLIGLKYSRQKVPTATGAPQQSPSQTKNPPYVSAEHFAVVILDLLRKKAPGAPALAALGASSADVVAALNAIGVQGDPYKPLYDILLPIWKDAQGDYQRFADALGSWYDSQMDRVSGWYKRSVQVILVYLGFIIAFAFNVDSIQIIRELNANSTLANSLAAATQAFYEANKQNLSNQSALTPTSLSLTKACGGPAPCTCDTGYVADKSSVPPVCRIDQSGFSQLPIGWTGPRWQAFTQNFTTSHSDFWLKLFGLAITSVAILLGAPFWFDVLGAIVNVRSAGTKPPTSAGT